MMEVDESPPRYDSKLSRQFLEACARGNVKGIEELSTLNAQNINVNYSDGEGNTALILASQAGYTTVVELIIDRFASVNIDQTNNLGQTALMKAAIQGRVSCARTLLRAGADPYRRDDSRGLCSLEWAEYVGRTECAHIIAHFMLQPSRSAPKKLSVVGINDFQQITRVVAAPLMGEVPLQRPRLNSAPIPRLEISECEGITPRRKSTQSGRPRRPQSSLT